MRVLNGIVLTAMALLFGSCAPSMPTYQGENYAHKPTHAIYQAMLQSEYERAEKLVLELDQDLVVVPRLREFSKDFSTNYAFIYFISAGDTPEITVKSVTFTADGIAPLIDDRERTINLAVRTITSPIMSSDDLAQFDLPYSRLMVFSMVDGVDASAFHARDELTVSVIYRINNGPWITETFDMKKYSYTDIAWPT